MHVKCDGGAYRFPHLNGHQPHQVRMSAHEQWKDRGLQCPQGAGHDEGALASTGGRRHTVGSVETTRLDAASQASGALHRLYDWTRHLSVQFTHSDTFHSRKVDEGHVRRAVVLTAVPATSSVKIGERGATNSLTRRVYALECACLSARDAVQRSNNLVQSSRS